MPADQKKYWLGFNLVRGIGPSRLRAIYNYFQHDLEAAWHAAATDLQNAGLTEPVIESFLQRRRTLNLDGALKRLHELGARICTLEDSEYPPLLAEIEDAPPLFYIKGQLFPEDERALAVVGTRRATTYGRSVAHDLTTTLAQSGVTIVSGLAKGIDTVAHQAALAAGGRTIAVLANGIDILYPRENQALIEQIINEGRGAIITEYPPRTPPDAKHFPARNRLISGLALGVLIVEAPVASGALLTAELAAEQGREIFAVPGNITSANSRGANKLIQDGAKLVMQAEDILEELNLSHQLVQTRQVVQSLSPTDPVEDQLLKIVELEPLHIDEIATRSGLSIQDASARMMMLALKGLAQEVYPMIYGLVHRVK
jgi:DNA processing protein